MLRSSLGVNRVWPLFGRVIEIIPKCLWLFPLGGGDTGATEAATATIPQRQCGDNFNGESPTSMP